MYVLMVYGYMCTIQWCLVYDIWSMMLSFMVLIDINFFSSHFDIACFWWLTIRSCKRVFQCLIFVLNLVPWSFVSNCLDCNYTTHRYCYIACILNINEKGYVYYSILFAWNFQKYIWYTHCNNKDSDTVDMFTLVIVIIWTVKENWEWIWKERKFKMISRVCLYSDAQGKIFYSLKPNTNVDELIKKPNQGIT